MFVKSFGGSAAAGVPAIVEDNEDENLLDDMEENKYQWSRGRLGYTTFHRDCCELIFEKMS